MPPPQSKADRAASDTNVHRNLSSAINVYSHRPQSLNSSEGSGELAAVVDDLLNQLNTKFTSISSELLAKSKC